MWPELHMFAYGCYCGLHKCCLYLSCRYNLYDLFVCLFFFLFSVVDFWLVVLCVTEFNCGGSFWNVQDQASFMLNWRIWLSQLRTNNVLVMRYC